MMSYESCDSTLPGAHFPISVGFGIQFQEQPRFRKGIAFSNAFMLRGSSVNVCRDFLSAFEMSHHSIH